MSFSSDFREDRRKREVDDLLIEEARAAVRDVVRALEVGVHVECDNEHTV
jgi:post-segregation antitoxin (ccd killing protein)